MSKLNNVYSDLLNEIVLHKKIEAAVSFKGFSHKKYTGNYGLRKEMFNIRTEEFSKKLGKDKGDYSIISFESVFLASPKMINYLINHISLELKKYVGVINKNQTVLVVALGNQHISADSLGPSVMKNIITTRGMTDLEIFKDKPNVCTFMANVFGVTGVQSFEVISALIENIKPDKLIVIDTLCAGNYFRLGTSFQINNASIVPGGGINNAQKKISKKTIGVDVVSIGVPLVVYANSLLQNAVDDMLFNNPNNNMINKNVKEIKAINEFAGELKEYDFNDLIVTLKDIEECVEICGKVIGYAINKSICGFSVKEQNNIINKF